MSTNTIQQREKHIEKFMYIESSQVPLTRVSDAEMKYNMLDPTTGKPYQGLVMQGCFADLTGDVANNNKRYYDIPQYLEMVKILKKQIHSKKGVYGELEHPEGYGVDYNNVSHKIIDIWYDETTRKVMGIVVILNTEKGKIAQEIIKSGGQLAISARAAGEEIKNADGTSKNFVKLLTTYDLVYHPGFSAALLDFVKLNESQIFTRQEAAKTKTGFSGIIYEKDFQKMNTSYAEFITMNENVGADCFYEYYLKNMNESQDSKEKSQEEKDQDTLQKNETNDEDEKQANLKKAADKELNESKQQFFQQVFQSQKNLEDKAYFDNAAGFVNSDSVSTGIE